MDLLRAHERAVDLDLPDLVDFMLGTGVRIGEALAVRRGMDADGERPTPPGTMLREGNGATRQLDLFRRTGDVAAVVRGTVDETRDEYHTWPRPLRATPAAQA